MAGKITGSAGILLVADVVKAANYYRDKLGFSYDRFWDDPPAFVILNRDDHHVMLRQVDDPANVVPHGKVVDKMWNLYFWVDDVEAVYQEMKTSGATIDYEMEMQEYGVKEFGVQDLDGHHMAFGQIID